MAGLFAKVLKALIADALLKKWPRGTKSLSEVGFPSAVVVAIIEVEVFYGVLVLGVTVVLVAVAGVCVVVVFIASKLLKILLRGTKSEPVVGFSAVVVATVEIAFTVVCAVVVKIV
jgi:glutaredoxin-related protein